MVENNIDAAAMELSELLPLLQQKLIKPFEQLSKELLTSKQQMTPIVDKLIKQKFVARKYNKVDRRVINISLSLSGKRYIEILKMGIFDMLRNKFHSLNDDDLGNLYKSFA